ncbi:MAG: hypothetical protein MUF86_03150 [Akkermansiaceae bacterium]|nr:hypothetical protein [Akkermansiaceae bacterium]
MIEFRLIRWGGVPSQGPAIMGQQSNKVIKRRRRADYLKRKKELSKLGGIVKKPSVKKEAAPAARKAPAKKAAAKKAPAKKAAKKVAAAVQEPVAEAVAEAAVEPVVEATPAVDAGEEA